MRNGLHDGNVLVCDLGNERIVIGWIARGPRVLKYVHAGIDRGADRIGTIQVCMHFQAGTMRFLDHRPVVFLGQACPGLDHVRAGFDQLPGAPCCFARRVDHDLVHVRYARHVDARDPRSRDGQARSRNLAAPDALTELEHLKGCTEIEAARDAATHHLLCRDRHDFIEPRHAVQQLVVILVFPVPDQVDVHMRVNQPGHDGPAAGIDDDGVVRYLGVSLRAYCGYAAVFEHDDGVMDGLRLIAV